MKLEELLYENEIPSDPISLDGGEAMEFADGVDRLEELENHGVFEVRFTPEYTGVVAVKVTHYSAGAPMHISTSRGAGYGDAEPPEDEELEWDVVGAVVSLDENDENGRLFLSWKDCPVDIHPSSVDDIENRLLSKVPNR